MGLWQTLKTDWHKFLICFLALDHLWRRIADWEEDVIKTKALFGRRKGDKQMNILTAAPKILKIIEDARSAEQTPAVIQLIADLEDFYKSEMQTATPVPEAPQTPPAASAAAS